MDELESMGEHIGLLLSAATRHDWVKVIDQAKRIQAKAEKLWLDELPKQVRGERWAVPGSAVRSERLTRKREDIVQHHPNENLPSRLCHPVEENEEDESP